MKTKKLKLEDLKVLSFTTSEDLVAGGCGSVTLTTYPVERCQQICSDPCITDDCTQGC